MSENVDRLMHLLTETELVPHIIESIELTEGILDLFDNIAEEKTEDQIELLKELNQLLINKKAFINKVKMKINV
jgi:hypothetical protein